MKNSYEDRLISEAMQDTGGNISKVARVLGIDYHALKQRMAPAASASFTPALGPEPSDITTLGRPGFEIYVIAVKRAGCAWPDKFKDVIADARRKFDAGTHEMFQTSNSGWVVQYLIPYLVPVSPRKYFSDMVVF